MENISFLALTASFVVLTVVMYTLVLLTLRKALSQLPWEERRKDNLYTRTRFVLIGWALLISSLSITGFLSDFSTVPPRFMVVLSIPLITMIIVTFSKSTREILSVIPPEVILRMQVFRVFVEILLWVALLQNLLPVQMTFEGRNFDVLAGITGPIIAHFFRKNNKVIFVWNLFGLGLLINIVTVAVLSLPTPFRAFLNEPSSAIVATFPFAWLPGLLVPLAYGLHFLSMRQVFVIKNATERSRDL